MQPSDTNVPAPVIVPSNVVSHDSDNPPRGVPRGSSDRNVTDARRQHIEEMLSNVHVEPILFVKQG